LCSIFTQTKHYSQRFETREILIINGKNERFVKLGDFGLSTFHEFDDQSHIQFSGSFNYMVPEVRDGRNYDTKADIYTVGDKKFGTRSVQFLLLISSQCFNGFQLIINRNNTYSLLKKIDDKSK
jgi:serine/threonine protein kinase